MYTLYWSADSGAFGVQALLEELGLPYRREVIDTSRGEHRTPAYLALNPMAQVPTLRIARWYGDHRIGGHDRCISATPSLTRRCYRHQAPALGRSPIAGCSGSLAGLYESDLRYYYPDRYTSEPVGAAAVQSAALERMDRLLAIAADLLGSGPYALGQHFSAVDLYLFMLVLWHPARTEVHDRHPALGRADAPGAAAPGGRADLGAALSPGW